MLYSYKMDIYGLEFPFLEVNPSLRVAKRGHDPLNGEIFLKLAGKLGEPEWLKVFARLEELTACSFSIRTSKKSKNGVAKYYYCHLKGRNSSKSVQKEVFR